MGGVGIRLAGSVDDYRAFTEVVREYIVSLGFEVDFQDVDIEIAEAQRRYGEPRRGAALLVVALTGEVVGIAAVRDLGAGVCELKRMYVRPAYRNGGVGKRLCEESVAVAKRLGYRAMRARHAGPSRRRQAAVRVPGLRMHRALYDQPDARRAVLRTGPRRARLGVVESRLSRHAPERDAIRQGRLARPRGLVRRVSWRQGAQSREASLPATRCPTAGDGSIR